MQMANTLKRKGKGPGKVQEDKRHEMEAFAAGLRTLRGSWMY